MTTITFQIGAIEVQGKPASKTLNVEVIETPFLSDPVSVPQGAFKDIFWSSIESSSYKNNFLLSVTNVPLDTVVVTESSDISILWMDGLNGLWMADGTASAFISVDGYGKKRVDRNMKSEFLGGTISL